MQEPGLFVTLAEIAGVFVGFGALIAVRSGGAGDGRELVYIRGVLSFGVWVVVVALTPVTISAYDIGERAVWLVSGLVALAGFVALFVVNRLTPEMEDFWAGRAEWRAAMSRRHAVLEVAATALLGVAIPAALVLVVLGLLSDREAALYLTAVVMGLLFATLQLLFLVYAHRDPTTTSAEAGQPLE